MMAFFKIALFLVMIVFSACTQAQEASVVRSEKEDFQLVTIADDLNHPWSLAFLPDGHYLVSERGGTLWRIAPDGRKVEISGVPEVYHRGQGGLLDIVPAPDFKTSGLLYFSYAAADEKELANTEVAHAKLNLMQNRLTDVTVIFRANPKVSGSNHWGSRLLFGPDGLLYITLGERFSYKKEAQNPHNHLGTIIRVHPDGRIPANNPFADGQDGDPKVFTYGNRNVQGIALRPDTDQIWFHEHGPKGGDEVNILKAGANYGWPAVTYGISYVGWKISDKTTAPGIEDPVLHWTPSIAPSGMAFYTGDKFPAWQGNVFVGALAHTHLRRLELHDNTVVHQEVLLEDRGTRIRDVRTGPDGFIYVLTDQLDGELLRLEPR